MLLKSHLKTDKIPTGIFYQVERPIYEDGLKQIDRKPLIEHIISDIDINKLLISITEFSSGLNPSYTLLICLFLKKIIDYIYL